MRIFYPRLYSGGTAQYTAPMRKQSVVHKVHEWIDEVLQSAAIAIDATVGNGHDTLFLAQRVGASGRVYGFDIQASALESAKTRLQEAEAMTQVTLVLQGHESMCAALPEVGAGSVKAILFNLGYLPGHDSKELITQPDTTVRALHDACALLAPGGLITLVLYVGHPGGAEEAEAVVTWAMELDHCHYTVERYDSPHQQNNPPFALKIVKVCD